MILFLGAVGVAVFLGSTVLFVWRALKGDVNTIETSAGDLEPDEPEYEHEDS